MRRGRANLLYKFFHSMKLVARFAFYLWTIKSISFVANCMIWLTWLSTKQELDLRKRVGKYILFRVGFHFLLSGRKQISLRRDVHEKNKISNANSICVNRIDLNSVAGRIEFIENLSLNCPSRLWKSIEQWSAVRKQYQHNDFVNGLKWFH